jgi:Phage tail assembly chaperone proteins, E, or 41 or 14
MTTHRFEATVKLSQPLAIDGKEVDHVVLHRPRPGELRGLSLISVLQMDFNTMIRLIPRVSEPSLNGCAVATMQVVDFVKFATEIVLLFVPNEERDALRQGNCSGAQVQPMEADHASQ